MLIIRKFLIALAVVVFFLYGSTAQAFSISPLKYTITLGGNDRQDLTVTLKNDTNQTKIFKGAVVGVKQDVKGRPIFENNIDIAENWIKINNKEATVKAGESKDFIFTVSVPKNTPPGAHYLGLTVEEEDGADISPRLATILILQVAGTANESVHLENFFPLKKYVFDKNWFYFLGFKNYGNIDVALIGEIRLLSVDKKLIFSAPVDLGTKLFAQADRDAKIKVPVLTYNIWPGLYNVQIAVRYGLTNQQIVGESEIWYFPIWFLIGVILFLFVIGILVFKKYKHEKNS